MQNRGKGEVSVHCSNSNRNIFKFGEFWAFGTFRNLMVFLTQILTPPPTLFSIGLLMKVWVDGVMSASNAGLLS